MRKLKDSDTQEQYADDITNHFATLTNEEASDWLTFKDAINDVAATNLADTKPIRGRMEWISD